MIIVCTSLVSTNHNLSCLNERTLLWTTGLLGFSWFSFTPFAFSDVELARLFFDPCDYDHGFLESEPPPIGI